MCIGDRLSRYLEFFRRPGEDSLASIACLLSEDIECERVILKMASREPRQWTAPGFEEVRFPVCSDVWCKAAAVGRGMVGFPSEPMDQSGPTGTVNVDCVRYALCLEFLDSEGALLAGAFLDKKCSGQPFTEPEEELLKEILKGLRDDERDRRSSAWEPT